jgi:adenylylsulfate kinase
MGEVNKKQKETVLGQYAKVIWFSGLPCSGKYTIGKALEKKLHDKGYYTKFITNDIDIFEKIPDPIIKIELIAAISKMFFDNGVIVINSFDINTEEQRNIVRQSIGRNNILEVYLNTPIDVCEKRDTKGLYKKAKDGELLNFAGVNAPFDIPVESDVEIDTSKLDIEKSVNKILSKLMKDINMEISFTF